MTKHLPHTLGTMADLEDTKRTVNRIIEYLRADEAPEPEPDRTVHIIANQLPQHPEKSYKERGLTEIEQIVWHHVGDPTGADVSPEQTAAFHVRRGWPGMGYHFYVRKDGSVYQTQYLGVISYHCGGKCNAVSVGVCLEGSFIKGRVPTAAQLESARLLNARLMRHLGLPIGKILQHRQIRQTACPGTTVDQWWGKIIP